MSCIKWLPQLCGKCNEWFYTFSADMTKASTGELYAQCKSTAVFSIISIVVVIVIINRVMDASTALPTDVTIINIAN